MFCGMLCILISKIGEHSYLGHPVILYNGNSLIDNIEAFEHTIRDAIVRSTGWPRMLGTAWSTEVSDGFRDSPRPSDPFLNESRHLRW